MDSGENITKGPMEKDKKEVDEERKKKNDLKKKQKEEAKAKKETVKIVAQPKKEHIKQTVEYYHSNAKIIRPGKNKKVNFNPNSKKNVLITSALPYVNNVPHLGNLIGCVLSADVYARFCRLNGYNTLYVCGTDEYGTATETKALEEKCTPQQLCTKFHEIHAKIYEWFDIDFDHFGRTSTPVHSEITHEIFKQLDKNGHIKKKEIQQLYCESSDCQRFLADRYVIGTCYFCKYNGARGDQCDDCGKLINQLELIDPSCKVCKSKPKLRTSFHYFLDLPETEEILKKWVEKASDKGFWSSNSKTITNGFLKEGLKSRCITRDLKWGVEVPTNDPDLKNKVFYVWFDAPIGYLSITANYLGSEWKNWWLNPENVELFQFMGKDNVTFHTIIFPSTLLGTKTDYTLVHHLSTTDYLNYEDKKFSKSNGTGVFGDDAISTGISSEVWRYYLLVNRPEQSDAIFKWSDLGLKNNSELLAKLGNLCNRVLKFCYTKYEKKTPSVDIALVMKDEDVQKLFNTTHDYVKKYVSTLDAVKIKEGLKLVIELSEEGNKFFQDIKPWDLIKTNPEKTANIVFALINFLRVLGCIAEPYLPSFSAKLYEIMNVKYDDESAILLKTLHHKDFNFIATLIKSGHNINEPQPLFKESNNNFKVVSEAEIKEFKSKFG